MARARTGRGVHEQPCDIERGVPSARFGLRATTTGTTDTGRYPCCESTLDERLLLHRFGVGSGGGFERLRSRQARHNGIRHLGVACDVEDGCGGFEEPVRVVGAWEHTDNGDRNPAGERNNFGRLWRTVRDELGVPEVTTHSFRKTVATLIDDEGLSARIGADQLGHTKVSMTQDRYMSRGRVHT